MEQNERAKMSDYRIKLFKDVCTHSEPDRIPIVSNYLGWRWHDFNISMYDFLTDYNKMRSSIIYHMEKYNFDNLFDDGSRNPYRLVKTFGNSLYNYDFNKNSITYSDTALCETSELPQLINNLKKFFYETILPRRFPKFKKITVQDMQQAIDEKIEFDRNIQLLKDELKAKLSIPRFTNANLKIHPFEISVNYLRGIKGSIRDMYEHPELFSETLDALFYSVNFPIIDKTLSPKISEKEACCFDSCLYLFGQIYLNEAQFEKFYYPYLKKTLDAVSTSNKTIIIIAQGEILRFADYFKDIPKGLAVLHVDSDNLFDLSVKLPNVAFAGGSSLKTLSMGTQKECIDEVRKTIDFFQGKRIILSQDKLGMCKEDTKSENLAAVCDYVTNKKYL